MRFLSFLLLLSSLLFSISSIPKAINFEELNKLTASNGGAEEYFGTSTAISSSTLVVGNYGENASVGSAYIYEYNSSSDQFEEVARLEASDSDIARHFGMSVAISGDTVVVGAPFDGVFSSGSAYIYEKPDSGWGDSSQETVKLTASDGDILSLFGNSVAISADTIVVGAYWDNNTSGSAYLYEKPGSGWANASQETVKLTASDGASEDYFGSSVAISGETVVVGALNNDTSGSAYLYEKPGSGWVNASQETVKLTASDGDSGDYFGASVAISADTIVVGALWDDNLETDSGAAYIYEKPDTGWVDSNQTAKLTASDEAAEDYLGSSVSISDDIVVVGAYYDDDLGTDSGAAYLYEKPDTGWIDSNQTAKLTASDGLDGDRFGVSVAISGDTIVIGADSDDTDTIGDESGSAYVFKAKSSAVNPAIIMYLLN